MRSAKETDVTPDNPSDFGQQIFPQTGGQQIKAADALQQEQLERQQKEDATLLQATVQQGKPLSDDQLSEKFIDTTMVYVATFLSSSLGLLFLNDLLQKYK